MELEEMKLLWSTMSERVEKLEVINKQHIMEITKQRYKNKFSTILNYEIVGTIICYTIALLVLLNFNKLDSPFYIVIGVILVLFLLVTPFISLRFLNKIKSVNISRSNYKETIYNFETSKNRWLLFQKLQVPLGAIIFFITIPLFSKLLGNNDFIENMNAFTIVFTLLVFGGVLAFSLWGYRCYKRIAEKAGSLLKELKE